MKDLITPLRDADENNMLHLARKNATKERLADVSGAALQMQRELLLFKEVRNMIHLSYRERKNKEGLTPCELFTEEYKELIVEGEKWMKGTASQCGYNQNNGVPILHRKPIFVVWMPYPYSYHQLPYSSSYPSSHLVMPNVTLWNHYPKS
ncbi:hypothetical protein R6Q57_026325 [Mikania cordata]